MFNFIYRIKLWLFDNTGCRVASVLVGVHQHFIFVIININSNTPLHNKYRMAEMWLGTIEKCKFFNLMNTRFVKRFLKSRTTQGSNSDSNF